MFQNLKVVELGSVLAAPSVSQFFAELGAKILKIENPNTNGDVTRSWRLSSEKQEISSYFACANWGKESLCLDLTQENDFSILIEIIKKSDVLISSYKPNDDKKLGLDYESVSKINPKIIYGHITGYQDDKVGYDAIIQAETGFIFMNGETNGTPHKMPVALVDLLAAHQLKEALLLGVLHKERTQQGSYWRVSLYDSAVASLANQATNFLVAQHIPKPMGSEHPNIVPYGNIFKTQDNEKILLAVGNDKQFIGLCEILEIKEIAQNPKFLSNPQRVLNRKELIEILELRFVQYTQKFLLEAFEKYKIPAGSVNNMQQVFENPQARDLLLRGENLQAVRHFIARSNVFEWKNLNEPPILNKKN